jgi:magnesium transporter
VASEQETREARLRKSLTWAALGAVDLRKRPRKPHPMKAEPSHDHIVDCALYVDGVRREGKLPMGGALAAAEESGGFVWIGLHEPTDEEISGLATEFNLPPLAVEDAVNAHQRPKLDRYGDILFVVFKTTRYVEHRELTISSEVVQTGEVMLFVGENFIISVRHGPLGALHRIRARLETTPELLRRGSAAVVYAVADAVVDGHLAVADALEGDVDEIEAAVFAPRVGRDVGRLYQFKREVLEFRRSVVPLQGPVAELRAAPEMAGFAEELRDVDDHLQRIAEQVAGFDELLNALLDSQLARVSVQQNDDMRKISAWVAIAAVPTAMAGIYGMNFDHMPELHWTYGYPLVIGVMVLVCSGLYRWFRKSGWL